MRRVARGKIFFQKIAVSGSCDAVRIRLHILLTADGEIKAQTARIRTRRPVEAGHAVRKVVFEVKIVRNAAEVVKVARIAFAGRRTEALRVIRGAGDQVFLSASYLFDNARKKVFNNAEFFKVDNGHGVIIRIGVLHGIAFRNLRRVGKIFKRFLPIPAAGGLEFLGRYHFFGKRSKYACGLVICHKASVEADECEFLLQSDAFKRGRDFRKSEKIVAVQRVRADADSGTAAVIPENHGGLFRRIFFNSEFQKIRKSALATHIDGRIRLYKFKRPVFDGVAVRPVGRDIEISPF